MAEQDLPSPPEKPLPSDCCNSGCSPCILDVYEDQLKEWEKMCKLIQSGDFQHQEEKSKQTLILFPSKYSTFKIVSVTVLTSDTNLYHFQAVEKVEDDKEKIYRDLKCKLGFEPSQYFIMQGTEMDSDSEKYFTRAYTPISGTDLSLGGCFEAVIKLYPDGKMSRYLQRLKAGDVTQWRGPYGGYNYKPNCYKRILMLGAGTGIAPLYALARSIVNNEEDDTTIKLLYCCRDEAAIILRKEIHSLRSFWNFSADIYLPHSSNLNSKPLYGEILKTARLGQDAIALELGVRTMVLICGSPQFCKDIEVLVRKCNVDSQHIHIF